jgi:hypothetical protein
MNPRRANFGGAGYESDLIDVRWNRCALDGGSASKRRGDLQAERRGDLQAEASKNVRQWARQPARRFTARAYAAARAFESGAAALGLEFFSALSPPPQPESATPTVASTEHAIRA